MCVTVNEYEGCNHAADEVVLTCVVANCGRRFGNPNNPLPHGLCPFCSLPSPPTTNSSAGSIDSSRSSRSTVSNVSRSSQSTTSSRSR